MKLFSVIKNSLSLMLPSFGRSRELKRERKRAYTQIKSRYTKLYYPLSDSFTPFFNELIEEVSVLQRELIKVYPKDLEESGKTYINRVLSLYKLSLEDYSLDVIFKRQEKSSQKGLQAADITFKNYLLHFKEKPFKYLKKLYLSHLRVKDILNLDFLSLYEEVNRDKLLDIIYLIDSLPEPIKGDRDYILGEEGYKKINRLIHILSVDLPSDFLKYLVCYKFGINREEMKVKDYDTDFITEVYREVVEFYKRDREKFLYRENHRVIQERTELLFGDIIFELCSIYNVYNNEKLIEQNLTPFKFIDQLNICRNYTVHFFNREIQPLLKEILIGADFFHDDKKKEFQKIYDEVTTSTELLHKFSEDIESSSFSDIDQVLKKVKSGLMEEKDKLRSKGEIKKINAYIDEQIGLLVDSSLSLTLLIEEIKIDLDSAYPKIISNVYFFKKGDDSLEYGLNRISDILTKFNNLMRSIYLRKN